MLIVVLLLFLIHQNLLKNYQIIFNNLNLLINQKIKNYHKNQILNHKKTKNNPKNLNKQIQKRQSSHRKIQILNNLNLLINQLIKNHHKNQILNPNKTPKSNPKNPQNLNKQIQNNRSSH